MSKIDYSVIDPNKAYLCDHTGARMSQDGRTLVFNLEGEDIPEGTVGLMSLSETVIKGNPQSTVPCNYIGSTPKARTTDAIRKRLNAKDGQKVKLSQLEGLSSLVYFEDPSELDETQAPYITWFCEAKPSFDDETEF